MVAADYATPDALCRLLLAVCAEALVPLAHDFTFSAAVQPLFQGFYPLPSARLR
jgi:hypothetical protein